MKNPILVSTNEEKLEPSKALFLPVQGSAAVKGVKVFLILKGIPTAATTLESILDALNRIINWHKKRIQFEAAQNCINVAGYPPRTEEDIKQFQKELDEIKFAVATNFVLDHIAQALIVALGASATITALPALLIPGIVQVAGALLIALVLEGVGKGYDSLFAPIIEEEMAHLKPILAQCGPAHFSKITFEGSFKQNDVQVSDFLCVGPYKGQQVV